MVVASRLVPMNRDLAFVAIAAAFLGGCAISLEGGAQTSWQTAGRTSQEGVVAAGYGIGDMDGAILVKARGSAGEDLTSGHAVGSIGSTLEYVTFDSTDDHAGSTHFALDSSVRFGHRSDRDDGMLVVLRAGRAFSLGESSGTSLTPIAITSITIDPSVGAIAPFHDGQPGAAFFGVIVGLRWDTFSSRELNQ